MADAEPRYLKVHEVAERLSLDNSTVYKMIRGGLIPAVRIGPKAVRVPAASFESYLSGLAKEDSLSPIDRADEDAGHQDADFEHVLTEFVAKTGVNPFTFVERWKKGSINDTETSSGLLIQALSLRSALDRRVAETIARVGKRGELESDRPPESDEGNREHQRPSLFRRQSYLRRQ